MKKFICFALFLSGVLNAFSQQAITAGSTTKTDFLTKSKGQKTAAWVCLGGGVALVTVAGILSANDFKKIVFFPPPGYKPPKNNAPAELVCGIGGTLAMIGSIPLFISAAKNKHRSMAISFKNESAPKLQQGMVMNMPLPSINLVIRL